jgi:small subunit ribosomal protein S11
MSDEEKEVTEEAAATPEVVETPKAEASKEAAAEAPAESAASEAAADSEEKQEEGTRRPTAAELLGEELAPIKARKAKGSKNITTGVVHVKATFNNTIVSVTDLSGNVISWGSAGGAGFKGSRKSTAYAGTVVAQDAVRKAMSHGLKEAEVQIQGPGAGRESAVRAVQSAGVTVTSITDVTPVPHNGCRPRKRRRV